MGQQLAQKLHNLQLSYTPFDIVRGVWAAVVLQERM